MAENPPLTRGENPAPAVGVDTQVHLAGNWHDDDPIAFDEYFEAGDTAPERYDGLRIPQETLKPATHLVTRWFNLSSNVDSGNTRMRATQLLVPDINRRRIYLTFVAPLAVGFALVGSEPFSLADAAALDPLSGQNWITFCPVNTPQNLVIEEHTGPLWAACNVTAAGMLCGVMAVTC